MAIYKLEQNANYLSDSTSSINSLTSNSSGEFSDNEIRPTYKSVTFMKHKASVGTGLVLSETRNGETRINKVIPGSVASGTSLHPGMLVCAINNIRCEHLNTVEVAQLLTGAVGKITILASIPVPTQPKQESKRNVSRRTRREGIVCLPYGIRIIEETGTGSIVISRVYQGSPLAKSKIAPGHSIIKIDSKDCMGMSAFEVARELDNLKGRAPIITALPDGTLVQTNLVRTKSNPSTVPKSNV
ncbi:expressed unknown protein [Seminavis robusta]|uniref:PDZ domain-containing protein n=1 Tax=Seminavis robusta TaxID=568900 RepID=A0A9N8DTX8_9STRA|nr:expressed unknown protein [Seminavis robusta]|eukprot:Sro247_g098020.1 n/a (243) ;mRNA; r:20019-20747